MVTGKMKSSVRHKKLHTYVVCAYKESPYLENCIQSLLAQTVKSEIIIATSTPNKLIESLAEKYQLKLCINYGEKGLAGDWNFALSQCQSELMTIAHQDDEYLSDYTEQIVKAYRCSKEPIILFTDYAELRDEETIQSNLLLNVKRIMLFPLRCRRLWGCRWVRRRILSLGSAICCPSVTMVRNRMDLPLFKNNMKSNIDWQAWEELSRKEGSFVYISKILMKHRIHEDSTTSELLAKSARRQEDLFMYEKFWPKPVAAFIEFFYSINERSNKLK